jgi:hypothetical protein
VNISRSLRKIALFLAIIGAIISTPAHSFVFTETNRTDISGNNFTLDAGWNTIRGSVDAGSGIGPYGSTDNDDYRFTISEGQRVEELSMYLESKRLPFDRNASYNGGYVSYSVNIFTITSTSYRRLYTQSIERSGARSTYDFRTSRYLTAGEYYVDFSGYGTNGNWVPDIEHRFTAFSEIDPDYQPPIDPTPAPPATQVPEPSTLSLLGLGIIGLGFVRRRRV